MNVAGPSIYCSSTDLLPQINDMLIVFFIWLVGFEGRYVIEWKQENYYSASSGNGFKSLTVLMP